MKKVITVRQPWATLLATGKKRIETRSWKTKYRGELYIHAGIKKLLHGISEMPNGAWDRALRMIELKDVFYLCEKFPTGAVIGKVNLVSCLQIDELTAALIKEQNPDEYAFGDYTPGRYAWVMEDAVLFHDPVCIPGRQGLWNWDGKGVK